MTKKTDFFEGVKGIATPGLRIKMCSLVEKLSEVEKFMFNSFTKLDLGLVALYKN